jgi:hypothetical protein
MQYLYFGVLFYGTLYFHVQMVLCATTKGTWRAMQLEKCIDKKKICTKVTGKNRQAGRQTDSGSCRMAVA